MQPHDSQHVVDSPWQRDGETWTLRHIEGHRDGTFAEVTHLALGWTAKTHIVINDLTHVDYLYPGFYELQEHAQAWCQQWLDGRTDVQFHPAALVRRAYYRESPTETRS